MLWDGDERILPRYEVPAYIQRWRRLHLCTDTGRAVEDTVRHDGHSERLVILWKVLEGARSCASF